MIVIVSKLTGTIARVNAQYVVATMFFVPHNLTFPTHLVEDKHGIAGCLSGLIKFDSQDVAENVAAVVDAHSSEDPHPRREIHDDCNSLSVQQ